MARVMTARQRAALKKAQAASAKKRRGKGKGKLAAANRKLDSRKRRTRKALKIGVATAAVGGVAYGAYRGNSIRNRKNAAIKEAKTIQKKHRDNFRKAVADSKADPHNKRKKTLVRVHRRSLRIASARSVHRAIIKQHTGR
ncbi:hypothetical protein MADRUGA_9 [Mycobacterium phage Madruga]|uniref:Uncharacterized protein n=1 Tax=Mycobacterium phage Madruga TaxID=1675552 RepID=A0A0K1LS52_9CAUD|nr:hypothetical protein MADRUGA_9 [Mycobacterium phage Madruga]UOW93337.1 hypothetical protein SEA_LABELLE_11 [Mycobacterium phage Labelle]